MISKFFETLWEYDLLEGMGFFWKDEVHSLLLAFVLYYRGKKRLPFREIFLSSLFAPNSFILWYWLKISSGSSFIELSAFAMIGLKELFATAMIETSVHEKKFFFHSLLIFLLLHLVDTIGWFTLLVLRFIHIRSYRVLKSH